MSLLLLLLLLLDAFFHYDATLLLLANNSGSGFKRQPDAFSSLVGLAGCNHDSLREAALMALAGLAEDDSNEAAIVAHGGLPEILRACKDDVALPVRVQGIRCLRNLSFNVDNIRAIYNIPGALLLIHSMAESMQEEISVRVSSRAAFGCSLRRHLFKCLLSAPCAVSYFCLPEDHLHVY